MTYPVVTVLVPARQEADDITACVEAIAAQDYPVNLIEVIVVDGCSTDRTADVARRALGRWGFRSTAVLSNEAATASSNLNVGLAKASGDIVCRVDARTRIEPHYVRTCADLLTSRQDVAVVGGMQIAIARDLTAKAIGIARTLNNRWSMGGSRYRRAPSSGPSDTVYLGAFLRAELVDEGGWDERLVSNQDFDLNRRMARRGLVWFDAGLRSGYVPRASFAALWLQYRRFGRAKVRYWRQTSARPQPRQWALMLAPPVAAAAFLVALVALPWTLRLGMVGLGAGAAAMVEAHGSIGPAGGLMARVHSVIGMSIVSSGWWLGVVQEAIRPTRELVGSDLRALAS